MKLITLTTLLVVVGAISLLWGQNSPVESLFNRKGINYQLEEFESLESQNELILSVPQTIPELIAELSVEYGVDTDTALNIAFCESRFDPLAKNPNSSAKGIFQWTLPTWEYIGNPGDRFDPYENIKQFMIWYPKYPNWWVCKGY